jgi:uncharacterized protein
MTSPPCDVPLEPIDAGEFGQWVEAMTATLRGTSGSDVPCGTCVGCCSSHWPVVLRPEDHAVAARVPHYLVLEPDDAPEGLRYMGYRADGTCPMLKSGQCSVYAIRPQTCRDFDCRIFAAAGLRSAGESKPLINARIQRWRFQYTSPEAEAAHTAMRAAADFIRTAAAVPGVPALPTSPIAIAGLAFKAHRVFLTESATHDPPAQLAQRLLDASRRFDQGLSDPDGP